MSLHPMHVPTLSPIQVIPQPDLYSSYAVSTSSFAPGTLIARLHAPSLHLSAVQNSDTIQIGPKSTDNIEINHPFVFTRHSCLPNLEFRVHNGDAVALALTTSPAEHAVVIDVIVATRLDDAGNEIGIQKGETLTVFYPSTEWSLLQPFECDCGQRDCLKTVRGTKWIDRSVLKAAGWWLNDHVWALKDRQEREEKGEPHDFDDDLSCTSWSPCVGPLSCQGSCVSLVPSGVNGDGASVRSRWSVSSAGSVGSPR